MASTGWKHNAETLAIEYKREQDRVADLRRRLAEKEELLVAALSGQPPPTGHARSSSQVDELLLLVQTKDETIAKLSRAVAQADDQLQNNFGKITKIEQDAELQSVRLQRKLDEAAQELAKERSANAPTNIHWELREEITCLKNDIVFLKNENKQLRDDLRQHKAIDQNPLQGTELKKLRDMNASLMRQLQVEKRANTDELPFMRSDSAKLDEDDDDDEELPTDPMQPRTAFKVEPLRTGSYPTQHAPQTPPVFKLPRPIPAGLFESMLEPTLKPSASKKRKEISEELADLPDLALPSGPRKRMRPSYTAFYEQPQDEVDDRMESLKLSPPAKKSTKWEKSVEKEKSFKTHKKNFYAETQHQVNEQLFENITLAHGPTKSIKEEKPAKKQSTPTRSPPPKTTTIVDGCAHPFTFRAIVNYDLAGEVKHYFERHQLETMEEFWERVEISARTIWEAKKGEGWQEEFKHATGKAFKDGKVLLRQPEVQSCAHKLAPWWRRSLRL